MKESKRNLRHLKKRLNSPILKCLYSERKTYYSCIAVKGLLYVFVCVFKLKCVYYTVNEVICQLYVHYSSQAFDGHASIKWLRACRINTTGKALYF